MAGEEIAQRLAAVNVRITAAAERVGRDPATVRLVAVSKKVAPQRLAQAVAAGQRRFGENYLQEATTKMAQLDPEHGLEWHFIGHLQSNKAKTAATSFGMVETVDRLKLAQGLAQHAAAAGRVLPVLVQVNVGGEAQKAGVRPEESGELLRALDDLPALRVMGLMTMPPWGHEAEASRPFFRKLRQLSHAMVEEGLLGQHGPVELSMGMSGDFEVAVEEGATLVRVGSAIFGPR
ncbi:MAG: YggS family pyridoxal phosphate-dependent enzyme [Desulfurivibrio sp.]|nr:YggS family pyridoxal phosphate-dependent enzyme [Desulfurivibrio sp.]